MGTAFVVALGVGAVKLLTAELPPAPPHARAAPDSKGARMAVARLSQLHELAPELHFLPAHDRDAWEKFFGSAQRCVRAR